MLHFSIQLNRAAGDVDGLGPIGETFLFDGYLMAAKSGIDSRGRIPNKRTIYFNVCAGRGGFDIQYSLLSSCEW